MEKVFKEYNFFKNLFYFYFMNPKKLLRNRIFAT